MELANLTWPEVDSLDRNIPVILPIAALEQHGRHMPVFTDSMLLGEVVRRAQQTIGDRALFVPLMWLGNSHHHMDYPGTVSARPRVYLDLIDGLADNFISHGFRRIVFVNGHGGNIVPGRQATFEVRQRYRQRHDLLLLLATYWELADTGDIADLQQDEMGHACEWETSMVLRLSPELVKDHAAVAEIPAGNPFLPAKRAWTIPDRTEPGHIGVPSAASAEKGEQLFQVFSDGLVSLIQRVVAWDGRSWEG